MTGFRVWRIEVGGVSGIVSCEVVSGSVIDGGEWAEVIGIRVHVVYMSVLKLLTR